MVLHQGSSLAEQAFEDARANVIKALHNHVLDFKVNPPGKVLDCVTLFIKLFQNVLQHPAEDKYRKVRSQNPALQRQAGTVRGSDDLLVAVGWRTKVENLEKYWVFDSKPGGVYWRILEEAVRELEGAIKLIEEKKVRHESELALKKAEEARVREQTLAAIKEDREKVRLKSERELQRQLSAEAAAPPTALPPPPPAAARPVAPAAAAGAQHPHPHPFGRRAPPPAEMEEYDDEEEEEEEGRPPVQAGPPLVPYTLGGAADPSLPASSAVRRHWGGGGPGSS